MTDKIDISAEAVKRAFNNLEHGEEFTAADLRAIIDSHAAISARLTKVEAELKATLDREAETHKRHDARLAEVEAERDRYGRLVISEALGQDRAISRAETTEAKLAKAVKALQEIQNEYELQSWGPEIDSINRALATDPEAVARIIKAAEGRG